MRTEEKGLLSLVDLNSEKKELSFSRLLLEFYQCSNEDIDKIKEICEKLSSYPKILSFIVQDEEESLIKREMALKKLLDLKNLKVNNYQLFDLIKKVKDINFREKIFEKIKEEVDIIELASILNHFLSCDQQEYDLENSNLRKILENHGIPFLIFNVFQEKIKNYDIISLFFIYFPQNHPLIKKEIIHQIKKSNFEEDEKFTSLVGLLKKERNKFLKKEILKAIFSLKKTSISDLKFLIKKEEIDELKLLIIDQIAKRTSFNFVLENIYKKENNPLLLERIAQILVEKRINFQETINLINIHKFIPQVLINHLQNLVLLISEDDLHQVLLFQKNPIIFSILFKEIKRRGKVTLKLIEVILQNLKSDQYNEFEIMKIVLKEISY